MNAKIFLSIVIIIIVLGVGGFLLTQKPTVPGKYDAFATCLKDEGLKFFGAYWCPHCQKEKSWFGTSADLLPYVECWDKDKNTQNALCTENKIEGYPTWILPKELAIHSEIDPVVCEVQPGPEGQPEECAVGKKGSRYFKSWIFPDALVNSEKDPVKTDGIWNFVPGSRTSGEISLEKLSEYSSCELPV